MRTPIFAYGMLCGVFTILCGLALFVVAVRNIK
jgi:hypothetical protein